MKRIGNRSKISVETLEKAEIAKEAVIMNENLIKYLKEIKASLVKHDMVGEDWEERQEILDKLEDVVVYLNDATEEGIDFEK